MLTGGVAVESGPAIFCRSGWTALEPEMYTGFV
jgi:hypothetical protein